VGTSVVRGCGVGPRPEHSVSRNVEKTMSCGRVSRPSDGGSAGRAQKLSNGTRGRLILKCHVKKTERIFFS